MSDVTVQLQALYVYPVKSCTGTALTQSLVIETGLELDRAWMLVDSDGVFVSQRDLPRMTLIEARLKTFEVVLRAPGMLALHLALDTVEKPVEVTVWKDRVKAYDMGDLCARWFSDFLGQEVRLVRFDPEQKRLADRHWTGAIEAETAFQDGFPLLVVSNASLAEVNRRLAAAGHPEVGIARFRPSLVLDGLEAHGEDHLDEVVFESQAGPVRIKLVKPCGRCSIPDIDPATGERGHAVSDVLQAYRADPRLDGKLTFGMNAVIVEGFERLLSVGMEGRASYRFD